MSIELSNNDNNNNQDVKKYQLNNRLIIINIKFYFITKINIIKHLNIIITIIN